MGQKLDFASATDHAAVFDHDAAALRPELNGHPVRPEGAPPRHKTNIEMAIERRRELDTPKPTGLGSSRKSQPDGAASRTSLTAELTERPLAEIVAPEAAAPLEARQADTGVDRYAVHDTAPAAPAIGDADCVQTQLPPVSELVPRRRQSTGKKVIAALIALLIGTSIGYIAGKGAEQSASGTIESSDGGLKLRLDSDLR
jgi:hypothetical protein